MKKQCRAQSAERRVKKLLILIISLILIPVCNGQAIIKTKAPAKPNPPILNNLTYSDSALTLSYYVGSKTDYIQVYLSIAREGAEIWNLVSTTSQNPAIIAYTPIGIFSEQVAVYAVAIDTNSAEPFRTSLNSNVVGTEITQGAPEVLTSPTLSGISLLDGTVTLTFMDNSTSETGHRLYRGINSNGSGRAVVSSLGTVTGQGISSIFTDEPDAGYNYYYWVSSYNASEELFSQSLTVNIPALPPAEIAFSNGLFSDGTTTGWSTSNNLGEAVYSFTNSSNTGLLQVTTAGTNNSRPLVWAYYNGYLEAGQEYNVQFDITVNSGVTELYAVYTNAVVGDHTDLTSGTYHFNYTFTAITVNVFGLYFDGTSTFSISLDNFILTKTSTGLAVPQNLTAVGSSNSIALSWGAVTGAIGYQLEYKLASSSTWSEISDQAGTTYNHTGLDSNTAHNYRVRAYNNEDVTAYSTEIYVHTLGTISVTNYYISSSTGNDANNGRSPATAWKTLAKLNTTFWQNLNPGDSVLFCRGDTWTRFEPDNFGRLEVGVASEGIITGVTIGAYGTGEIPVITDIDFKAGFQNCVIENIEWNYARLFATAYVYLSGSPPLQVVRYTGRWDTNHLIFQDCVSDGVFAVQNFYKPSILPLNNTTKSELGTINNLTFRRCIFKNSNIDNMNLAVNDSLKIYNCEIYNASSDGIDIPGGIGHKIYNNKIVSIAANGVKLHSQFSPLYDYEIYGNFFLRCGRANSAGTGGYAIALENTWDGKIYNNTVVSTLNQFIGNRDRNQLEGYYGNYVGNETYNNIFIGGFNVAGSWGIITDWDYYYQLSPSPQAPTTFVSVPVSPQIDIKYRALSDSSLICTLNDFHHNTYYDGSGQGITSWGFLLRWVKTNNYPDDGWAYDNSKDISTGNVTKFTSNWLNLTSPTEVYRNPLFANPFYTDLQTYGDYSLQAGSSERNAGSPVSGTGYTIDLNGNAVNQTSPHRGCFQN